MTRSPIDRQSELPSSVPLFRYAPDRVRFSWRDLNPVLVRSAADLPQYLILGNLDPSTFECSAGGWSARWQGTEHDSHFEVLYKFTSSRWEIRQTWCGLDGGTSFFPARLPLEKVIAQGLYTQFPRSWDEAARSQLESAYQLTVVEQPENAFSFCGIPDGAFRTIVFPVAVRNLRPLRQWIQDLVEVAPLPYPITVEAKLVFQAINCIEGKAPAWTTQEAVAFSRSVVETGLAPQGFPAREVARDGSAAWTLRREIYFVFIGLPFAGLTDFLSRMASTDGPVRAFSDPELRFEQRPIVNPAGFELQTRSLALWDQARTTRSFLQIAGPTEAGTVPDAESFTGGEQATPAALARLEEISSDVVTAIEQIFQQATTGGEP